MSVLLAIFLAAAQPVAAAPKAAAPPAPAATPADAERKALATQAVGVILPPGSYGKMMSEMMGMSGDGMISAMFDLKPEDIGIPAQKGKPQRSMREELAAQDPHFEERMRLTMKVFGEEMSRISAAYEPALREGLALSMAKRFTTPQLRDLNAFFATDSGRAYAGQSLMMWTDPEMMKAMVKAMPALLKEMPVMMKKVEAATAHLPPPPKPKGKKSDEAEGDEDKASRS